MRVGVSLSSVAVEDHYALCETTPIATPPRMLLEAGDIKEDENFLDFTFKKVNSPIFSPSPYCPPTPPLSMKFRPPNIAPNLAPPSKP